MIQIENEQILSDLFGHWPDFHDAEVIALRLDASDHSGPTLEAEFAIAEMSNEVDERGFFRDRQRVRATLHFHRVARLRLTDFLYQNVVSSLELSTTTPQEFDEFLGTGPEGRRKYRVTWGSSIGCRADFLCDAIEVQSAVPFARTT
jgi:hypothetical protein